MEVNLVEGIKDIREEITGFNILIAIMEAIPQIREKQRQIYPFIFKG